MVHLWVGRPVAGAGANLAYVLRSTLHSVQSWLLHTTPTVLWKLNKADISGCLSNDQAIIMYVNDSRCRHLLLWEDDNCYCSCYRRRGGGARATRVICMYGGHQSQEVPHYCPLPTNNMHQVVCSKLPAQSPGWWWRCQTSNEHLNRRCLQENESR